MDIVLSRILKYLNGCLDNDYMYQIGLFIVEHYVEIEEYDLERFLKESTFTKDEVLDFCSHLGYDSYEDFQQELISDYMLRISQIRARMLGISSEDLMKSLDQDYDLEEIKQSLEKITEYIFNHKRVILIGALYPMSIAVEFQTDLITFGKVVIQYHHFDKGFQFDKDDLVIFMSATGRSLQAFLKDKESQNINQAHLVLMTQNKKFLKSNSLDAHDVIVVPGKFDGIQFNYQMMLMFDILRIYYYQKYYI